MITTPDASVSQNDPDNNNVNGSVIDNQTVSQDHAVRKRIISKSVLGLISLFMLVPILVVLLSWTQPVADIWTHMKDYVLPQVLKNTAILLLMVTVISGTVGTTLAWVTSMYRFPGQRFFSWALMLPLAIPAYVLAFVTIGIVDFSGPLQTGLRDLGISTAIPSVRNVWGAGLVLSLALCLFASASSVLIARQAGD